tara:strand:+ start:204 stop:446 length:243 start_codon:yes stop_codon:yes gene_type:complete
MNKDIIQNPAYYSIVVFVGLFFIIVYGFPDMVFEEDGSIRQFGVGFRRKTIFPMWLLAIFLGILSYMFVQVYCMRPKLMF